jgi:hypothetical protein
LPAGKKKAKEKKRKKMNVENDLNLIKSMPEQMFLCKQMCVCSKCGGGNNVININGNNWQVWREGLFLKARKIGTNYIFTVKILKRFVYIVFFNRYIYITITKWERGLQNKLC